MVEPLIFYCHKAVNMIPAAETLFHDLVANLNTIATEKDILARSAKSVALITGVLSHLRNLIKQHGFQDTEEEIHFYKYVKPKFHALYIYHATVFNIESDKPIGSKKTGRRYFHSELRRIDNFFYHHLELYRYYRSGKTHLDKEYFVRGQAFKEDTIDIVTPVIDREFCTPQSINLAVLLAFEQVKEYIQNSMLETEMTGNPTIAVQQPAIAWTDTKAGLIELAYALHAAGALNNGKASLKQTIEFLQTTFHIDLGNTSRTFQAILARKKGDAAFLDRLKSALLKRIEEFPDD